LWQALWPLPLLPQSQVQWQDQWLAQLEALRAGQEVVLAVQVGRGAGAVGAAELSP